MRKPMVAVIGRSGDIGEELHQTAYDIGRRLAEMGIAIVCGGRDGVMEAVCKGAKSADGTTIGIAMSYGTEESNHYVDYVIPTGLQLARNVCVVSSGDLVISIGGSFGTLSEISHAMNLGKQIVGIHSWTKLEGYCGTHEIDSRESVEQIIAYVKAFYEEANRSKQ